MNYTIEHTEEEILIRLPMTIPSIQLQNMLDYFRYVNLGMNNQVQQSQIDELAEEVQENWWRKNKERFRGIEGFEDIDQ